jgi:cytochrome c peroxidase
MTYSRGGHRMNVMQAIAGVIVGIGIVSVSSRAHQSWSDTEIQRIESLWIGALPDSPPSRGNRVADDPRAARLGQRLFFDPAFSANGEVSCASCHAPDEGFAEHKPVSEGIARVALNAPTVIGAAYSPWQFWDGRADSLWAQALGPLENAHEMGGNRLSVARTVARKYAAVYEELFGPVPSVLHRDDLPERAGPVGSREALEAWMRLDASERLAITQVFVNVGKALEAYERKLIPSRGRWSRFDLFVERLRDPERDPGGVLSAAEEAGLRLFVGRAQCVACHNTPLMTDHAFHDTGLRLQNGEPLGRSSGIQSLLNSEFSCLGRFADPEAQPCVALNALLDSSTSAISTSAVKTPGLRSVTQTAPYGVDGRFATLTEVLRHKNRPPADSQLPPLELTDLELAQLEAFLGAVATPIDADPSWLQAPMP